MDFGGVISRVSVYREKDEGHLNKVQFLKPINSSGKFMVPVNDINLPLRIFQFPRRRKSKTWTRSNYNSIHGWLCMGLNSGCNC
jgi:hypothetical protein